MIRIFLIIIIIGISSACTSVKDGLILKKKSGADEFLVKKKNPLVLPPEFDDLPVPDEENLNEEEVADNEIEKLLSKNKDKIDNSQINENSSEIEKNVLKKIKTK
jgi:hypothetical protein